MAVIADLLLASVLITNLRTSRTGIKQLVCLALLIILKISPASIIRRTDSIIDLLILYSISTGEPH